MDRLQTADAANAERLRTEVAALDARLMRLERALETPTLGTVLTDVARLVLPVSVLAWLAPDLV